MTNSTFDFDHNHLFSLWYPSNTDGFFSVGHWLAHKKLVHFGRLTAADTLAALPYSPDLNRDIYNLMGPRESLDADLKKSWRMIQPTQVLKGYILRSLLDKELCATLLETGSDTLLYNHPNPETGAVAPKARNGAGNTLMQLRLLLQHNHQLHSPTYFLPDHLG